MVPRKCVESFFFLYLKKMSKICENVGTIMIINVCHLCKTQEMCKNVIERDLIIFPKPTQDSRIALKSCLAVLYVHFNFHMCCFKRSRKYAICP